VANEGIQPIKGDTYVLTMREFSAMTNEADIRQQIKEFLDWLNAEGIGD
jgi:hypothetical protein